MMSLFRLVFKIFQKGSKKPVATTTTITTTTATTTTTITKAIINLIEEHSYFFCSLAEVIKTFASTFVKSLESCLDNTPDVLKNKKIKGKYSCELLNPLRCKSWITKEDLSLRLLLRH